MPLESSTHTTTAVVLFLFFCFLFGVVLLLVVVSVCLLSVCFVFLCFVILVVVVVVVAAEGIESVKGNIMPSTRHGDLKTGGTACE